MATYNSNLYRMTPEQLEQAGRLLLAVAKHGWPERFGQPRGVQVFTEAFESGRVFLIPEGGRSPAVVMGRDGKPELRFACKSCGKPTRRADLAMVRLQEVCPDCIEKVEKGARA